MSEQFIVTETREEYMDRQRSYIPLIIIFIILAIIVIIWSYGVIVG